MTNNGRFFSLLPYLETRRGNFNLHISLVSDDSSVLERTSFPFLSITDTDPLTQLIEAEIMTDAGSDIEKVFLLVQKDRYLLTKDELWPINNRDIEDAWQKALTHYSSGKQARSIITLAGQLDSEGKPAQFAPLFYCKTRQLYFHPPCPKCGLPLQQCEDDDLLNKAGLPSYSGSLKRHLYCRSCASTGKLDFYVYELEQSDPQTLRDRWSLINKFKLLVESGKNAEHLPCAGCPNYKECYGADQRVASRIVPFSFYPFHMLVFKAMTLNALDFLPLVSGAAFQELEAELEKNGEPGRSRCLKDIRQDNLVKAPCLFDSDNRAFMEVLYLKLSFLAEVFQDISSGQELLKHPDLRLSLDKIWIKLSGHGSLLPFLWNFRVKAIDIFRQQTDKVSTSELPDANGLYFTGLAWFYALLVNKRQDMSKVYLTLKEVMDKPLSDTKFSFDNCIAEDRYPAFHPSNIFYDPEGKPVNKEWHTLWQKGLQAGWSLLKAGTHTDTGFSQADFLQQLEELRREVRAGIFAGSPMDIIQPSPVEDKAISGILKNIYEKWSSANIIEEEEMTETIMLSPEANKKTAPPSPAAEAGNVASTTVIIPAGKTPSQPEQPLKQEDVLTETVIMSPQGMKDTLRPSPGIRQKKPDEVPAETVIISAKDIMGASKPDASAAGGQAGAAKETEEHKKKPGQDFLAETIILKPGELKGKGKK